MIFVRNLLNGMLLAASFASSNAAISSQTAALEVVGDWIGVIELASGNRRPLVVHIRQDESSLLSGTMDDPSRETRAVPIADISFQDMHLTFIVPKIDGKYTGDWDSTERAWRGEWSQKDVSYSLLLRVAPPPLKVDWQVPSDGEIAKLISERNAPRLGQGIVIGILSPDGQRFVSGGTGVGADLSPTTLFEIGSISKVFTALILCDMVNKGEVSFDDPAEKYLPDGHRMPQRSGKQITLRDLSTHRSGLPRMADDMGRVNSIDGPFRNYGEPKLLAFLDRCQLTRDVGSQYEYSNLGVGLLGYLLGRATHSDYETLVRRRITDPLGMKDTVITLRDGDDERLAPPFDRYMRPAKPWELGIFAGAGGIRSTAADMLIFSKAVLDSNSPISAAMKTSVSERAPGPAQVLQQAIGWQVMQLADGRELLVHGGQSGGYQSNLILEPRKGTAVIALTNSQAHPAPDDIALHILIGTEVEPTPQVPRPPFKIFGLVLPIALSIGLVCLGVWRKRASLPSNRT